MYKVTLRKRAAKEYLRAIFWYKERSLQAAENFVKAMNEAFSNLKLQPLYYRNTYKNFPKIKLQKYPYALVYFIDEEKESIVIITVFHVKRNPKNKFAREF